MDGVEVESLLADAPQQPTPELEPTPVEGHNNDNQVNDSFEPNSGISGSDVNLNSIADILKDEFMLVSDICILKNGDVCSR